MTAIDFAPSPAIASQVDGYGTHAARPAVGTVQPNYIYFETDTGNAFQNQSGAWVQIALASAPVTTVFGRAGAVVATSGDYTVGQVTGAAPLASPALTGVPTTPTAAALTNNTQVASTAYTDAAVAVETSARTTAQALLAPLASPALTGNPTVPTQTALTNNTRAASTAYADAAVAVETSRATTAEGLKVPLAGSGSMAGQLGWAAQATAIVKGAQVAANPVLQNYLLAADANPAVSIGGDGKINFGAGGASATDTTCYRSAASTLKTDAAFQAGTSITAILGDINCQSGNFHGQTAGKGLLIKEGSNAKQGVVTLVGGTATVANTSVTASSRIFLTAQSLGTVSVASAYAVTARSAGTSFTITASIATDTSVIAYEIFEPG